MSKDKEKLNNPTTLPPRGPRIGGLGLGRRHGGGIRGLVEKPKDFKGTMRKLIKYLKPYYVSIIVVLILAMASTVFTIISPKILGDITNEIVVGIKNITQGGIDFSAILHLITILVGLYLIGALCSYLQGWIMTGVAQKVTYNLRKSIALKINRLPLRYFDTQSHGDILSRVTNDVDTCLLYTSPSPRDS